MDLRVGTPKTLEEAIKKGLQESWDKRQGDPSRIIALHVQDFQAQRFCRFTFNCSQGSISQTAMSIWKALYPSQENRGVA